MENRRKKLRERVGLKIFATVISVVCVFVCFMSLVLTVICLKNDVFFTDDTSEFLENVTENIAWDDTYRFVRYLGGHSGTPRAGMPIMLSDDGYSFVREDVEGIITRFLPENSNYAFLVRDLIGRDVYCTVESYGEDSTVLDDYSEIISYYFFSLNVFPNKLQHVERTCDDFDNAVSLANSLFMSNSFRGIVEAEFTSGNTVVAHYVVMTVGEDGSFTYSDEYDEFMRNYEEYQQENYEFNANLYADIGQTEPMVTMPMDIIANGEQWTIYPSERTYVTIYLKGEMYVAEERDYTVSTYVSKDPQIVDSVYYGTMMVDIISHPPVSYPVIFICSAVLLLICLIYLCCAAGYRYPSDSPSPNWFDKIPFEFFIAAAAFGIYMLISSYVLLVYKNQLLALYDTRLLEVCLVLSVPIFFGVYAVLTLMTVATRLKTGNFFRYTVIGMVVRLIARVFRLIGKVISDLKLTWKVAVVTAAYFFYNVLALIASHDMPDGWNVYLMLFTFGTAVFALVLLLWAGGFTKLRDYARQVAKGDLGGTINKDMLFGDLRKTADDLENVGEGVRRAVDERMRSERLKTELITNVSHDLKTPLTSIVNYIDILSKDEIESETAREHIDVLKRQAARMKKLIEDLVEVSKASSGNVAVNLERTDVNLLLTQSEAEYAQKFENSKLEAIVKIPERKMIASLDGRLMWRVLDNLYGNICKYAMPNTRVYITAEDVGNAVRVSFKNISRYPLEISGEDLAERFVRGDSSRNTEGSGLGLSIAKSLCDLQGVGFAITIDGDLFKAELIIPKIGDEDILEESPDEAGFELREARAQVEIPEEYIPKNNIQTDSSSAAEEVPPQGDAVNCQENTDTD